MGAEKEKATVRCQSGTAIWRECMVFLGIMFVSGIVGGVLGGIIGAAVFGPYPADWGFIAASGFGAGVYLVSGKSVVSRIFIQHGCAHHRQG